MSTSNAAAAGDDRIVKAVIHPSIGVARLGNSVEGFLGPEVPHPRLFPPGFYRDATGALKRQSARFRVYGVNAFGDIVAELTADNADIEWSVHLANKKAAWYQFQMALDVPESASAPPSMLRNVGVADRSVLSIDPGARQIAGRLVGGASYAFDSGEFMGTPVYLGELRTDEKGRLIVLGGRGVSASHTGVPATTFANNEGWHDDVSDGPVRATVSFGGRTLLADPAWIVVGPPNYAPLQKSVRTMWDLMTDLAISLGQLSAVPVPSFNNDIRPIFERMCNLQWVNAGFAAAFGWEGPFALSSLEWLQRLNDTSVVNAEFRRVIYNSFRRFDADGWSAKPWPWLYGDAMSIPPAQTPRQNAALTATQLSMLDQWAAGNFVADYDPHNVGPPTLDDVPLAEQGTTLDRAAMEFCLADAFHPGCELTWPMRQYTMYSEPYRIAVAPEDWVEPSYGPSIDSRIVGSPGGPLGAQAPGGLTRWMAVPWQTDTASCRSGYVTAYDPYVPTFWPARVPNHVLAEEDYEIVMDGGRSMSDRLAAFAHRSAWLDPLGNVSYVSQINNMVAQFGELGVVESRDGPDDPQYFPTTLQVENVAPIAPAMAMAIDGADSVVGAATMFRRSLMSEADLRPVDLSGIDKVRRFPNGLRT